MDTIETFFQFFRSSLTLVENSYYGSHSWNEAMLNHALGNTTSEVRQELLLYLDRHGERVFCYELYYQIRKLIEEFTQVNPEVFKNVKLECELRKELISDLVEEFFSVQTLEKEYIPDFLLHGPGNFDYQHLIVEVKSNPKLTFSGMKDDLLKIQEFITRYHYECGIFLTINTNPQRISNALSDADNKEWLQNNIINPELITIMCKKKNDVELFERTIYQLLN